MTGLPRRLARGFAVLLAAALALGVAGSAANAGEEAAPAAAPGERKVDPQAAAGYFDQAEVAWEEERWKDAADFYWKAIEADPTHYLAHVRYQAAQARAGAKPEALVGDYDSFAADFPDDARFRLHRLRLDACPARVTALDALAKAGPRTGDLMLELGRALLESGDAARAAKSIAEAQALLGAGRTDVLLLLAEAEFRAGQAAPARTRLDKAVAANRELFDAQLLLARFDLLEEKWAEASRRADLCLQLRPTWVAATLVKAEALSRQDQREPAIAALEALRAKGRETLDVLLALGELQVKAGTDAGYAAGAALYDKVLAAEPTNGRAIYGSAWILERQGKFAEAEAKYRASATSRPADPAPVNSIGYCLLKQGKIEDAKVQFKKAVDLDPTYVPALANLGSAFDAQANYPEAIRIYERILKMKGQERNLRAIVNAAFDHEAVGAFPKAEELLQRGREIAPEDALLATWLGDNLYFQEKWKDAIRAYQDAIAIDPKSFYAHRGLGYTLGRQKKWADAVAEFEKAREIKPKDQDVLLALGDIYSRELGDLEKALKAYEEYVQAGGTNPDVPARIEEIRKELEGK